jgi:hypothetical protein
LGAYSNIVIPSIEIPVLPIYPETIELSASGTVVDGSKLVISFKGEGKCHLLVRGAYSDSGKKSLIFKVENSILKVDLESMHSSGDEFFIVSPNHKGVYDKSITYLLPDSLIGFNGKVYIDCLVYPIEFSNKILIYKELNITSSVDK